MYLYMVEEEVDVDRYLSAVVGKGHNLETEWTLHRFTSSMHLVEVIYDLTMHRRSVVAYATLIWHLRCYVHAVHVKYQGGSVPECLLTDLAH
jgi:hypothetical protein